MAIVQLQNVHKYYPLGNVKVHAVKGVSFDVGEGDFISIAGPSGSGKSTILNIIGCIDVPSEGIVTIDGKTTSSLNDREITVLRHRTVGFIFQNFNLVPVLNVYENIEFPLLLGKTSVPKNEWSDWIGTLIRSVGLERWTKHRPSELSGGQQQRVAIARSLVCRPRIVLADEPTANLDSETGEAVVELMKKVNREFGTTFIFSTHDQSIVDIASHIIRLQDGTIVEDRRQFG